jgi:threonyl-tRNA synthetase
VAKAASKDEVAGEKDEVVSEALKAESTARSYWYILTPDGKIHEVKSFDLTP